MKRILYPALLLFICADLVYSFMQHYHCSLDGDMASIILPGENYRSVMKDPLGLSVLLENKVYASPNRFFAHQTMSGYFKTVPLLLQGVLPPIDSVYAACAFAKTAIQLLILFLFAACITGISNPLKKEFILAAALITPLFQTYGYAGEMGIILHSITYTFFYSLPCALLMLFFLPFFNRYYHNKAARLHPVQYFVLFILVWVLTFNGPVVTGVVTIVCPMVLFYQWLVNYRAATEGSFSARAWCAVRSIPFPVLFFGTLLILLSGYSLWLGRNSSENLSYTLSLAERYKRIPHGLFEMMTNKLGLPLLILIIVVNMIVVHKVCRRAEQQKLSRLLTGFVLFALSYILLLPLGGYRIYRPDIVRFDTMMPVIIGMVLLYGCTSFFILKNISPKFKKVYASFIIVALFIYTVADAPTFGNNSCERQALTVLSHSEEGIVFLEYDCTVMEWEKIHDPQLTRLNSELLQLFGITKKKILYYQR
jgi:hypothetical protein